MSKNSKNSLRHALQHAISLYNPDLNEEQGGFILKKSEEYFYVPVKNENTGKPMALALYTADKEEFNQKVVFKSLQDDFEIFASFHTHPKGMRALPSGVDLRFLFTNFPINFIYSHNLELNRFDFDKDGKDTRAKWKMENVFTFNDMGRQWLNFKRV